MRSPTDIEQQLFKTQREIEECPHFSVDRSATGELGDCYEESPALFRYLPDWQGVVLSRELCIHSPRITEIGNRWRTNSVSGLPEFHGEFRVTDLFTAVLKHPPELSWSGSSDEERRFFAELRVIDDTPVAATGQLAAIRIQPHVDPLEIWYYDMDLNRAEGWDRQYVRLDLTYTEYIQQLALTKGTFGWQYLFTDEVSLGEPDFKAVRTQLTTMLDVFPVLFPAWDYTELAQRLEARL
ncbi:hypothetical protein ACFWDI_03070 [Streptomyces sp. NPDC060064]|uniref:hypothetical protein n=1 Tax=Streptomyces sp. NPDC060064 TaxID=3347049 RepID=UPI00368B5634